MRVNPDNRQFTPVKPLPHRFRCARNGADGNGVVAAEGEHEPAVAGVLVHLLAQGTVDGADGTGPLHVAVVGVVGVEVVVVGMYLAVVGDGVV